MPLQHSKEASAMSSPLCNYTVIVGASTLLALSKLISIYMPAPAAPPTSDAKNGMGA